ncbi:C40 family peptidase [Peribacillus deserti]|uniref:Peptidase n=1 Tax=Peribacillus deserti TaxID=673318 RepID=A0A2N5M2F8_9BACI|nr:C40 family peptidase [Peribacillus deserti]PLT28564.1 peptidase [Peribacillus deserti]
MNKWVVNVPVATVWTSYDSARDLDIKAVKNPVDIQDWLKGLTYETSLELCNKNLVQTQVLLGEEVLVTEEKEGWSHVICLSQPSSKDVRGYPGWIPTEQLIQNQNWSLNDSPIAVIHSKKAMLTTDTGGNLEICFQTVLPFTSAENGRVRVDIPEGTGVLSEKDVTIFDSVSSIPKGNGEGIAAAGERFVGLPYLWGGVSSFGYDCSGFSYTMCKANGYTIPRDAHDQLQTGAAADLNSLRRGDLLYFAYEEGKGSIHHVGIYYGNGKLLHSPKTGNNIEIIPLAGTIYEKEICAARRYGAETEE